MSENCNQDCGACSQECEDRKEKNEFAIDLHELSNVKKVIGVVSGKGGVGKSLVTSLMAVAMNRCGYKTAILDADITGPSIPKAFGLKKKAISIDGGLIPVASKTGIEIMSINLLLENDTDPVVWRGPLIAGTVKQFWSDVIWKDIDYMFVDLPPGTGDVALTVFQSIPIEGIIVVTSPQELVSMIVEKAAMMANMMNVPILALVENMSYYQCPDCGIRHDIFGTSTIEEIADKHDIDTYSKIPIDTKIATACDKGLIELLNFDFLENVVDKIEK
ncbi:MAG: Mrp/NBP35 family ATP-binding protein [Clostridiales bacterium]|nr:Mrp/NBP35 family ATP-binding protein [Clostridiales bacterium]